MRQYGGEQASQRRGCYWLIDSMNSNNRNLVLVVVKMILAIVLIVVQIIITVLIRFLDALTWSSLTGTIFSVGAQGRSAWHVSQEGGTDGSCSKSK